MVAEIQGIGDVADMWPLLWLILRGMVVAWFVGLFGFWRVTVIARRRAYGPGGGRRWVAPNDG